MALSEEEQLGILVGICAVGRDVMSTGKLAKTNVFHEKLNSSHACFRAQL